MVTINEEESQFEPLRRGSLAFHIRRLRQWHGVVGLSQRDLAELAGFSSKQVQLYESTRYLPQPIAFLLAVSIALRVPVEWLIAPEHLKQLRANIEERRTAMRERDEGQTALDLPRPGL